MRHWLVTSADPEVVTATLRRTVELRKSGYEVGLLGPWEYRPSGLAKGLEYRQWRLDLPTPLRSAFAFESQADSMAVLCSLRSEDCKRRIVKAEFPLRGGLGAFSIRAKRAGLAFREAELLVGGPPPKPEPVTLTEEIVGRSVLERESMWEGQWEAEAASVASPGERPTVSVVIPFFNLAQYLPETVASVRRQTFRDFEIVVVNDGSTDPGCGTLLSRIDGGDVRVIHKANGGLASARNAGFREARGKWVLPLDADDLIAPDYLEKTVRALSRQPALSYVTTLVADFESSIEMPTGGWCPWGADPDLLPVMNCAGACTALFVRDDVLAAGGYDESLTAFEDWELYARLAGQGKEGLVLPEFLFFYRRRPNSMVRTEGATRRFELRSRLLQKHLGSASHPDRAARLLLAEREEVSERLRSAEGKSVARLFERGALGRKFLGVWRSLPLGVRQRFLGK